VTTEQPASTTAPIAAPEVPGTASPSKFTRIAGGVLAWILVLGLGYWLFAKPASTSIAATFADFQNQIPILAGKPVTERTAEGKLTRTIDNVSVIGLAHNVAFTERADKPGAIESVIAGTMMLKDNEASIVEAQGLVYKLVCVASGTKPDVQQFADWLNDCIAKPDHRRFGSVDVAVSTSAIKGGAMMMVAIE